VRAVAERVLTLRELSLATLAVSSCWSLTIAEATRSRINAFGIEYEGKTGLSTSEFSWAA
jgi:hypothetical protein